MSGVFLCVVVLVLAVEFAGNVRTEFLEQVPSGIADDPESRADEDVAGFALVRRVIGVG
jgi:hypothetical protein